MKRKSKNVIIRPFREKLPAGQNIFEIDIPETKLDREYYFSDLEIIPSFHSQQAVELKLNDDPEFTTPVKELLTYNVTFNNPKFVEIPEFVVTEKNIASFVKTFNAHVDEYSPKYHLHLPVWFDWVDVKNENNEPYPTRMNTLIETNMEKYYDVGKTKEDVFDVLPSAAKNFPLSNNYALPSYPRENVYLRLRMIISPHTKVILRSEELIKGLGFIGHTPTNKQYHFVNDQSDFAIIVARQTPFVDFEKIATKIDIFPMSFQSPNLEIKTSHQMLLYPDKIVEELNQVLKLSARKTNFILKMGFVKETVRYRFIYPDLKSIEIRVNLPKRVATALGYEEREILSTSRPCSMRTQDIKIDFEKKSLILCLDTGPVIVSQQNYSSDNLIGSTNQWLSTLTQSETGKLKCRWNTMNYAPPINLSNLNSSQRKSGYRIIRMQLFCFDDNGNMTPLDWPCSAYIQGQLVGYECNCRP